MAREGTMTLSFFPWRAGLATAGQQTTVPEQSLWQAQNVTAGIDGLLQKRPGLKQWGQTLVQGDIFEPFLDASLSGWVETNDDTALLSKTVTQGQMRMNCKPVALGNETLTFSRAGTVATDASIRMVVQAVGVQAYTAAGTNADTFHFRVAVDATTGWEFAIWSGGLYYKAASGNTYTLVTDTENVGAGKWTTLDIRIDADGNTLVYMDDVLVDTILTSLLATPSLLTANSVMEVACEGDPTQQYSINLTGVSWADDADGFTVQEIVAVSDFRASVGAGSLQHTLVCAAGDYIYHDAGNLGVWRPIERKAYDRVTFTTFRKQICWVESAGTAQSKIWLWTGRSVDSPEELDEAPTSKFAVEHQTRLWVAGDSANPLRVYYSGDRETNVWFAPDDNNISDRFDTQLKAGYLEVPSRKGDEITAIFGDHYGNLILFTKQAVYQVSGSGPQSYAIRTITQDVGCENYDSITQVGNDVWFLSREGCHAVSATDKYGDLQAGFVSGTIQDLWGGDASSVTPINKTYIDQSRLRYNSTLGLVYLAVPLTTDNTAAKVFVFNVTTQEWYGPWEIDSRAMDRVEIISPVVEVIMHGGEAGKLLYTDTLYKSDAGTAIDAVIESALLNGRTLDPLLAGKMKTWKRLRIYLLPRGEWDIKTFWRVDNGFYQDPDTVDPDQNKSQNVFEAHTLTEDWKIGADPAGRLRTREEMGYFEIRIDKRGYAFAFKLQSDGNGEDFAIQGFEVDFIPDGYERD